jgi:hypothetical protein
MHEVSLQYAYEYVWFDVLDGGMPYRIEGIYTDVVNRDAHLLHATDLLA